ncbi:MAG TPA: prephenate dehydrogenase [Pseudonocardiaceae bacterium]|nr:prephenate dehydrogenase [Pseudonocardiaceae bacterium]
MRDVCVLGLGLIGGSVLRAAVAAGVPAWGASGTSSAAAATADGYDVDTTAGALRRAADRDALVVLAVPLTATEQVLRQIAAVAPRCRLTDVVSVKAPVADLVRRLLPDARYVGGHPMAGTAESGWPAGSATLFRDAAWVVLTENHLDGELREVWLDVVQLALDTGAHVVPVSAADHDAAVARISHLPHVLAAVLASVGADGGPLALALAAGSFADATRVAGTNPELVRAMCEGNRSELLAAVDDTLGRLGAARGALASTGSLRATLHDGHRGRLALDAARAANRKRLDVELAAEGAFTQLAELGGRGGRIVALDGSIAAVDVPA